jgi:hypothetical protein
MPKLELLRQFPHDPHGGQFSVYAMPGGVGGGGVVVSVSFEIVRNLGTAHTLPDIVRHAGRY